MGKSKSAHYFEINKVNKVNIRNNHIIYKKIIDIFSYHKLRLTLELESVI